ncbi:ribonuclease J [Desulfovibrio litoralis]|uniref:Ribonuclease J n=1 Tax=Desulfovibrio litoralis DSM 11393 TaxID=1121455 RepID=A0A1M7SXI0_9BACT|nr:ribonuclease J [Desulfovibrio litoralis]SHN63233.1 ribonuclease J [Desulfovibrio litoralis DSM 11393]
MFDENRFLTITPLGGLGEIGMNCMEVSSQDGSILIDCGLMFPENYHLGIDVVIPRFDHIISKKDQLKAIILTHGHEDHIGALPWLVKYVNVPIYGSKFTLALVEHKLRERGLLDKVTLIPVKPGKTLKVAGLKIHFFPVCHSIIDGLALGIDSPVGKIIHTGDFKIDKDPLIENWGTDLKQFKRFAGKEGVRLLMSDSTNIEQEGWSINERKIVETFRSIFKEAKGRIIVTLFSSHIQRIQEVLDCAKEFGRKVGVSGRSLGVNIEIAKNLGYLNVSEGDLFIDLNEMPVLPDDKVVFIVTGSQGEPMSALSRIVRGGHKQLSVHQGDTVLLSSRMIPGNVEAVTRMVDNLYRLGAEVCYDKMHSIHASGHAYKEELKAMLLATRPKTFIPVHGEYRHLVKHSRLAVECGVTPERAIILEDGQPITLLPVGIRFEEPVAVDSILVDGKGVGDVGTSVLRDRQILGDEGMLIAVLVIDEVTWNILYGPAVFSRGFVFEEHFDYLLEDAKCLILDVFENDPHASVDKLQDKIRSSLRRFFKKILERDPIIVPVIATV